MQILRYGALKPSTGAFSSGSAPRLSGDAAFALARVVASRLYGVSPGDPVVFLAVPALVAALSIVATWRPASAGAAASPLEAVRGEQHPPQV